MGKVYTIIHYVATKSFNIDNVIDTIYREYPSSMQNLSSVNFTDRFHDLKNIGELRIVHLHGFVEQSDKNYVFSLNDYMNIIDEINPWMVLLSELFASEPFIIAGTSLNEPDLEYYFAKRKSRISQTSHEPTILVEPYADSILEKECRNNNIVLVKATMKDFMDWIVANLPAPKTTSDLLMTKKAVFDESIISNHDKLQFYTDFQILNFDKANPSTRPSQFFFGAEPTSDDINQNLDIERHNTFSVFASINETINKGQQFLSVIVDEAYSGKSTYTLRILEKLYAHKINVLKLVNQNRIDIDNTIKCLRNVYAPTVLWFDNIADRMSEVNDILEKNLSNIYIIGTCRDYRYQIVYDISIRDVHKYSPSSFDDNELIKVIHNYQ